VYAFFTCADDDATPPWETHPVPRPTQAADLVSRLEAALVGLLAGPTEAEQAAGYTSLFSERTAGALNGVSLGLDGTAVADLGDIRPFMGTASTSAGMQFFLSQLNATVFQFEEVAAVEYRINGSCQAFWEWLQSTCMLVDRPDG
jgi:spore germination protein GerM